MTTETKDKDAKQIRAWAEQEKRKADLPGYGAAYRKAVEQEAQRRVESAAKTAVVEAKPPGEGGIQLKSGEWVDKAEFEKLSPEDKELLNKLGTRGFRDYYAQKEAEFKAANVGLGTGEWVSKEMYDALSAEDKELLNRLGVEKFNKQKQTEFENFKKDNIQLKTGEWIKKEDYNKLPTDWQSEISRRGVEGFQSWLKTAYGGATEYVIADVGGAQQVFGVTQDPNIGLDAGGNRIWIGGRWPDAVKKTKTEIIGSGIPGRWPAEVKEFTPTAPPVSIKEPTYTGLPTALGGTWGMTPETLAVQKLGGEVITYPRGITRAEAQMLTEQAIKQLSPVERERYEAEVAAIESMPGETIKEKLAAREQVRASEAKLARQSARYEAIGGKLVRAQLGGKETLAVELKTGELIPQEEFDNLSKERQKLAIEKGREAIYVKTAKGEWIDKEWFEEELTPGEQKRLLEEGIRGLEDLWAANETAFKMDNMQLPSGEWVNRQEFNALPPQLQEVVRKEGLKAIDISGLKPEEQFKKMQEWKLIDKDAKYGGVDKETGEILLEDGRPWHEKYLTAEMAKGVAIGMIPIAGTWYHWSNMSNWERGLSIALDVLTFVPYVGAVSAGVRAGKPIVAAVGRAALAEAKAPITALAHPVATVKTMIYPVETVLRPSKVPLTALEIRTGTVRLPVKDIGSARDAMEARDIITKAAIMGDKPAIEIAGKNIELSKIALQQKVSPAAIHTTQDISPFLTGVEVQAGREGGLFVSPSLHTRFTSASAFGDITPGGVPGAIIIRDEAVLARLQPSGKIYRGTAEIEQVIGAGTKLPPPSQILMTRDVSGNKLTLAIIGKPLSRAEIARLKFIGSADLIRDIFRPAAKITGKGIDELDELAGLADEVRSLEKSLSSAQKAGDMAEVRRITADIEAANVHGRKLARAIDLRYASKLSLRPIGISTGDYIDRISYNELARNKPAELARILRDVPRADRERLLGEVEPEYRAKVQKEIEKLPARAPREEPEVPRGLTPVVPRVGLPRAEVPVVPEVIRAPGVPRAPLGVPGVTVPTGVAVPKIPPRVQPGETPPKTTPPVLPPGAATRFEDLTEEQKAGSIAWKQGWCYHLIYPPYGEKEILHSSKPFPGVRIHKGEGSAYKSPVREKGTVPHTVERDMGIVDIKFTTPKKYSFIAGKEEQVKYPKVHYRPDPKQKTKVTSAIGSIITEGK